MTDPRAKALPARGRDDENDLLTIEAQESNRAAKPAKSTSLLKITTPRAPLPNAPAAGHPQDGAKLVQQKQTIEHELEFKQYEIERGERPLAEGHQNQPQNALRSQKSKIDQLFQDPEQKQKFARFLQKLKKTQELKTNRSEKRSNMLL